MAKTVATSEKIRIRVKAYEPSILEYTLSITKNCRFFNEIRITSWCGY